MWNKQHPDLIVIAKDWNDLEPFLQVVRKQAGHRRIDLDIEVHGEDSGLYLQYVKDNKRCTYQATMGYLCNEIDRILPVKKTTVYLEACYSGRAYKNTMRHNGNLWVDGGFAFDDYEYDRAPLYPIYGVGSREPGFGNLVYLQHKYNVYLSYEDLRRYETEPLDPKDAAQWSQEQEVLYRAFELLYYYGS